MWAGGVVRWRWLRFGGQGSLIASSWHRLPTKSLTSVASSAFWGAGPLKLAVYRSSRLLVSPAAQDRASILDSQRFVTYGCRVSKPAVVSQSKPLCHHHRTVDDYAGCVDGPFTRSIPALTLSIHRCAHGSVCNHQVTVTTEAVTEGHWPYYSKRKFLLFPVPEKGPLMARHKQGSYSRKAPSAVPMVVIHLASYDLFWPVADDGHLHRTLSLCPLKRTGSTALIRVSPNFDRILGND